MFEAGTPTWLVQTGAMGTENDYGVVSDGLGFEDSPDCEAISGGINSKGPHGLAIGREANLLQWGFYAAPDRMTQSARRAFLNAIVYMRQFDGHRPLVTKESRSRAWLHRNIDMLEKYSGPEHEATRTYYTGELPPAAIRAVGIDPQALHTWVDEHIEWIRKAGSRGYLLDTELLELGISNRDPAFLDWLDTTLAERPDDPVALRLAARYLRGDGRDAATTRAWIAKHREHAFFSDVGGYRWFADTRATAGNR